VRHPGKVPRARMQDLTWTCASRQAVHRRRGRRPWRQVLFSGLVKGVMEVRVWVVCGDAVCGGLDRGQASEIAGGVLGLPAGIGG
jgi:hypothetical protein